MRDDTARNGDFGTDCRHLADLLAAEHDQYRRLLRLAWRQNSYMRRQDVDRLDANALEWARYLAEADQVRIARERHVAEMAGELGLQIPPGRVSDLLDYAAPELRRKVESSLRALRRAAGRLAHQNELNRHLAEFCLDLAEEESRIFRNAVLEEPAGSYGQDARATGRGPGGYLVKQA